MIEKLVQHINSRLENKLTDSNISILSEVFRLKTIRKHQYLLQSGDVSRTAAFVINGALKKYTIDNTGKENIIELYIEDWWAGDRESFMVGTPSPYYIDAVENSELLISTKEDFLKHQDKLSFLLQYFKLLNDNYSFSLLKRLQISHTLTAEEKLDELQNTRPEFLQRFPQHIIASYLGMTKETLSRIRSMSQKK